MRYQKPIVFFLCLLPFIVLLYQAMTGQLGADIGKELVLGSGIWALRFLLFTLMVTPLRQLLNLSSLLRYRRMLGLYTWFYASVHMLFVLTYLLGWSAAIFVEEFAERPYMAVGIIAWLMLVPLGLTSNRWSQRKLKHRWKSLHQSIYVIAILVCAHFIWLVRSDYGEVLFYCVLFALVLLYRLKAYFSQKQSSVATN